MSEKMIAPKGKVFFCKELNMYCKATTDKKHEWVEIDEESEVSENE